jgi:hypothetical protein
MIKKCFLLVFTFVLSVLSVHAQPDGFARVRAISLIADAPVLQFYGNGMALGQPVALNKLYGYLSVPPGVYEVQVVPEGADASAPIITTTAEAEAGHDYTIVLVGSIEEGTAQADVIDETAAFTELDTDTQTPLLFIHDLAGAPPINVWVNGQPVLENLAYGGFTTVRLPVGDVDSLLVTSADDPNQVLLRPPHVVRFESDVSWLLALQGTYSHQSSEAYSLGAFPTFHGEVTTRFSDALTLGRFVEGVLQIGEQVAYPLHLEQNAALDILLSSPEGSRLDPQLLIFDANGNLVAQNDERIPNDALVDAGFDMLVLPAGDYNVVASSFNNSGFGLYRLWIARTEYM